MKKSKSEETATAYNLLMTFDFDMMSEIMKFLQPSFVIKEVRLVTKKFKEIAENAYTWRAVRLTHFGREGVDLLKNFFAVKDDVDSAKFEPNNEVIPCGGHFFEFYRRCVHLIKRTQKHYGHIRHDLQNIHNTFSIKRLVSHYIDIQAVIKNYSSYNDKLKEDISALQRLINVKIDPYRTRCSTYYFGEVVDGKADGYGELFHKKRLLFRGFFKNGKKNGRGMYYDSSGSKMWLEVNYLDDKEHGKLIRYVHVPKSNCLERVYFLKYENGKQVPRKNDVMEVYHPYTQEYAGKYVGAMIKDAYYSWKCSGDGSIFDHNNKHVFTGEFFDGKKIGSRIRVYTDILRMYKKRN
jgi:hypothetical protein